MSNYVSEAELNDVKGLIHYLNTNMRPNESVGVDVTLTDHNGESLGTIRYKGDAGFVLEFPS